MFLFLPDLIVVIASLIVLGVGSNGQMFATSAIRYSDLCSPLYHYIIHVAGQRTEDNEVLLCVAGVSVSSKSCVCYTWIDREERGGSWDL